MASRRLRLLVAGFPLRRPGFEPGSGHVEFLVEKVALGKIFSEYFGFPLAIFISPIASKSPSTII
jgi:hypothetical protein